MNYFKNCKTVAEVKKYYRKLAMLCHPDREGGDLTAMQEVNRQYQLALQNLHGQRAYSSDGREFTYQYDQHLEQLLMAKLEELLRLSMGNVEIHIIGTWIWVTGDTKPFKEALKKLQLAYHWQRQCWYFHDGNSSYRRSNDSLDELAEKYGARSFKQQRKQLH